MRSPLSSDTYNTGEEIKILGAAEKLEKSTKN
jgi:hypothetical protein